MRVELDSDRDINIDLCQFYLLYTLDSTTLNITGDESVSYCFLINYATQHIALFKPVINFLVI